jgi:hypothetical protein
MAGEMQPQGLDIKRDGMKQEIEMEPKEWRYENEQIK